MTCSTCAKYEINSWIGVAFSTLLADFYVDVEENNGCHGKGSCLCKNCGTAYLWEHEDCTHNKLFLELKPKQNA